jgi:hypothetical protein
MDETVVFRDCKSADCGSPPLRIKAEVTDMSDDGSVQGAILLETTTTPSKAHERSCDKILP